MADTEQKAGGSLQRVTWDGARDFSHALLEVGGAAVVLLDAGGTVLRFNRAAERISGHAASEVVGRPIWEVCLAEEERPAARAVFEDLGAVAFPIQQERTWHTRHGARVLSWSTDVHRGASGAVEFLIAIGIDVTEQRAAVRALAESEARHRALLHHFPGVVSVFDQALRCVLIDGRALRCSNQYRADMLLGRTIQESYPGELVAQLEPHYRAALAGRVQEYEVQMHGRTFACIAVPVPAADGVITHLMVVTTDVTDVRQVQQRLQQADRLASLGTLAAGMGHELNNPLTYVLGNLAMAEEALRHTPAAQLPEHLRELEALVREAQDGARRVARIVRDLKGFSSPPGRTRRADVSRAVHTAVAMVANAMRHRAHLVLEEEALPPVRMDEGQLGQVLVNLLLNAIQAIPEGRQPLGQIAVRTTRSGPHRVTITVSDDGTGIAEPDVPRIFEPFFTTRPVGEGTGLGLSLAYSMVTGAEGRISVESTLGTGSTFRVELPAAEPDPPVTVAQSRPASAATARVLVLDDDAVVARSVARMLSMHLVDISTDARDALQLLEGGQQYDLILCDVMMPGMSGLEFFEELCRRWPLRAASVVFITGGAFSPRAAEALARLPNLCLHKPLDLDALRQLVRERISA